MSPRTRPLIFALLLLVAAIGRTATTPARRSEAATPPSGFSDSLIASGLSRPTAMAFAPDGRIFVSEQGGTLRVIKNGVLLSTPFLTLTVDSTGERGLLGVAFDPDFVTNHYVYVYHTVPAVPAMSIPAHNRVSRYTADGDVAVADSEHIILDLNDLSSATNHNGGGMHFGPDGKLYISAGENANGANAQSLANLLGKLLRLNPDGSVPTDNPFFASDSVTGIEKAIWAYGLRNPFTFAFQPGTTRLFIDDVGENTYEEIDDGIAGSNYGWPTSEGPSGLTPAFRAPLYYYTHSGGPCAIIGGAFYNPSASQFPSSYVGKYFFADLCANWIHVFDPAAGTAANFATGLSSPVALLLGPDGGIYYLNSGNGTLGRILYSDPDTDGDGYTDSVETGLGKSPSTYCPVMRADLDGDGVVSILDLARAASEFTQAIPPADPRIDQDKDGSVSVLDMAAIAEQFLEPVSTCP